jgi:hypothetical protein
MNAAPLCFQALTPETASEARISDLPRLPNRGDAEFGTSLTVALSTTRGSMSAMTGGGQAANSIEYLGLSYCPSLSIHP